MEFYRLISLTLSILILTVLHTQSANGQTRIAPDYRDVVHFMEAYGKLSEAVSLRDSIDTIQTYYIDRGGKCLQGFIQRRNFTAEEYAGVLKRYPLFWESMMPVFRDISYQAGEIERVIELYSERIPNFTPPVICLSVGTLRTGGTIDGNTIFIGTEIASADERTDISEMGPWLTGVLGKTEGLNAMVAHEVIHTLQRKLPFRDIVRSFFGKNWHLSTAVINEGVADFLSEVITGLNINRVIYEYGVENEEWIWSEYLSDLDNNPFDYSKWLYNGGSITDRPADLGYFVGYRIAEAYYGSIEDKDKAISDLLYRSNYRKINSWFLREILEVD